MGYEGQIFWDSLPYQYKVPSATTTQDGVMTKEQVAKLNSISPGAGVNSVTASLPITSSGGINPDISITPGSSAGETLVWDGTQWVIGTPGVAFEIAGAATAAALPVMTNAIGRIVQAGTTYQDMLALRGISTTAAIANGDPISVSGNAAKTGDVFVGLTTREAQYAADGAVIPESLLQDYIDGTGPFINPAPSGSWYRRLGHAISAAQIYQDWGEPQQVP